MTTLRSVLPLFCFVIGLDCAGAETALAVAPETSAAAAGFDLRPVHTIANAHPKGVAALAVFDESRLLMSTGHSREVKIWEVKSGKLVRELPMQSAGRALAFSPSGKLVAAGGGEFAEGEYRGGITTWNTADWKEVRSISLQGADVNALAFVSEETLISGGHSGLSSLCYGSLAVGKLRGVGGFAEVWRFAFWTGPIGDIGAPSGVAPFSDGAIH